MLARRLTIVFLLVTLFGIGLSALVAEAGRSRSYHDAFAPCAYPGSPACTGVWTRR